MSTVRGAILTSIAIVSGGFLLGQILQPDTSSQSIQRQLSRSPSASSPSDQDHQSFSQSDLNRLPLAELKRNLQNLQALSRNVQAERSILLNKLVEVERRIESKKRRASSSVEEKATPSETSSLN